MLTITIDNPPRRNALDDDAITTLITTLQRAQTDEMVRAVLLRGAGNNFCSGFDIVARNSVGGERPRVGAIQRRLPAQAHLLVPALCEVQVPVVAAVRGYAAGIGLQLLLAADFVICAQDATLLEPFIARGMTPDSGASWLLPRAVGPLRARQMLMLGRRLSGEEAQEWGIAHRSVPAAEVESVARDMAVELAAGPTVALGLTKWLMHTGYDRTLKDQMSNEAFALELSSRSPDFREGLAAFIDKREPRFSGR